MGCKGTSHKREVLLYSLVKLDAVVPSYSSQPRVFLSAPQALQGQLIYKKTQPPRTLPWACAGS